MAEGSKKKNMSPVSKDFAALRLDVGASERAVKTAYKTLARALHPDKSGGDSKAFVRVQRAYERLMAKYERDRSALRAMGTSDAVSRRAYGDAGRSARRAGGEARGETTLEIGRGEDASAVAMGGDLKALGDERFEAGDHERALEYYDAAVAYARVEESSAYAELYHARARARVALERWTDAIDDTDRVIAARPLWGPSYALKGRALEGLGAWSRAAELYREQSERAMRGNADDDASYDLEREFADGLRRVEEAMARQDRMASVLAHRGRVVALAMAPPSRLDAERDVTIPANAYVATIGEDNYLKVFSVPHGECVRSVKLPVRVTSLKWSPEGDGSLVVIGQAGFVGIWRFHLSLDGKPEAKTTDSIELVGLPESVDVTAVDFDRTGEFIAVGASDGSLCVWDATHATLDLAVPAGLNAHKRGITSLAFHPVRGRNQLTTGSLDGDGRVWDLVAEATETAGECLHTLRWKGSGAVIDVNYLSCGRLIVTSTSSSASASAIMSTNRMLVWSSVSGRLCKWYDAHSSRITAFSWHPHPGSRNIAVTGCDDGVLRVWSIRASPSGAGKTILANGDYAGSLGESRGVDVKRSGAPLAVAHSPMGGLIAVSTRDGHLRIHDSDTLEATSCWRASESNAVTHVGWSPLPMSLDASERLTATSPWMVVTGGEDGQMNVWKVARGGEEDSYSDDFGDENALMKREKSALESAPAGVFTARDVKTWWDDGECASEVTPREDAFGLYLGPSPEDKPIHKALSIGEAPEQLYNPNRLSSKYLSLSLRDGESASVEAFNANEEKIRQLQSERAAFMSDETKSSVDKRAYSARFATDLKPLQEARTRLYAALQSQ